jgi:hypothetical protein
MYQGIDMLEINVMDYHPGVKTKDLPPQELPVNNYLKSREEIDAEFRFIISSSKQESAKSEISSATYGRIVKIAESYSYLHSIDEALRAPLEENY